MKKFILMLLIATISTNVAMSQKVTAKSHSFQITKTKEPGKPWYISIKGGGGFASSDYGTGGMYDVELGFTKYFSTLPEGWFWGVQLGSDMCAIEQGESYSYIAGWGSYTYTSYGYTYEQKMKPTIYLGPSIGYSTSLENDISFTLNLSANCLFIPHSYNYYYGGQHWGCLIKLQPGVWFNRFYIGLEGFYQTNIHVNQGGLAGQIGFRF